MNELEQKVWYKEVEENRWLSHARTVCKASDYGLIKPPRKGFLHYKCPIDNKKLTKVHKGAYNMFTCDCGYQWCEFWYPHW